MHSPTVRQRQSYQIQNLPPLDTSDLACNTKHTSTSDNLIEAARTTLVRIQGLDKPYRFAILSPVKGTTLDTKH